MKPDQAARRDFLLQVGGAVGAAWVNTQWPAILDAAQHAHQAVNSKTPGKLEVLTAEQARQVEAICAQIVPSDDLPGAREAGVVYFIDRALKTFSSEDLPTYQKGLENLNKLTAEKYPGAQSFADASAEQQEAILTELTAEQSGGKSGRRNAPEESTDFFEMIRMHTIFGFLADPSAGGNRNYSGWKVIGRDPSPTFSPPYGYYDKDYPGWAAAKPEAGPK